METSTVSNIPHAQTDEAFTRFQVLDRAEHSSRLKQMEMLEAETIDGFCGEKEMNRSGYDMAISHVESR